MERAQQSPVRRALVAQFALVLSVIAITLFGSQRVDAQDQKQDKDKSDPVTIVNTSANPVTVSGVVTVSGTSNVSVGNNTKSTPLFVQNVDEPGQAPYQETIHGVCGVNFCDFDFTIPPAGQRLVLQHISASMISAPGGQVDVEVQIFPANPTFENIKRVSVNARQQFRASQTSNQDKLVSNEPILLYVDPSDKLFSVHVSYSSPVPPLDQYVTLSGFLISQ